MVTSKSNKAQTARGGGAGGGGSNAQGRTKSTLAQAVRKRAVAVGVSALPRRNPVSSSPTTTSSPSRASTTVSRAAATKQGQMAAARGGNMLVQRGALSASSSSSSASAAVAPLPARQPGTGLRSSVAAGKEVEATEAKKGPGGGITAHVATRGGADSRLGAVVAGRHGIVQTAATTRLTAGLSLADRLATVQKPAMGTNAHDDARFGQREGEEKSGPEGVGGGGGGTRRPGRVSFANSERATAATTMAPSTTRDFYTHSRHGQRSGLLDGDRSRARDDETRPRGMGRVGGQRSSQLEQHRPHSQANQYSHSQLLNTSPSAPSGSGSSTGFGGPGSNSNSSSPTAAAVARGSKSMAMGQNLDEDDSEEGEETGSSFEDLMQYLGGLSTQAGRTGKDRKTRGQDAEETVEEEEVEWKRGTNLLQHLSDELEKEFDEHVYQSDEALKTACMRIDKLVQASNAVSDEMLLTFRAGLQQWQAYESEVADLLSVMDKAQGDILQRVHEVVATIHDIFAQMKVENERYDLERTRFFNDYRKRAKECFDKYEAERDERFKVAAAVNDTKASEKQVRSTIMALVQSL